jgi:hypothetical protein
MHYRNGREAQNGDKVVQLGFNDGKVEKIGILADAVPGNDFCNGKIEPIPGESIACLCDCLHVDDLAAILAEKGLDKRPEAKTEEGQPAAEEQMGAMPRDEKEGAPA